jgi:hypothetical protein
LASLKPKAISTAVLAFFVIAILSFAAGCRPDTCCWRAVLGAAAAYLVASWALRTISNITYDAMTNKQITDQRTEYGNADANGKRS